MPPNGSTNVERDKCAFSSVIAKLNFLILQVCLTPCLEEALLEDCRQADHLFAADKSGLVFVAQLPSAARQSSHDFGRRRRTLG